MLGWPPNCNLPAQFWGHAIAEAIRHQIGIPVRRTKPIHSRPLDALWRQRPRCGLTQTRAGIFMAVTVDGVEEGSGSTFAPLREPTFRRIWIASLLSNFGQLFLGVGAAWEMTQLSSSPSMV